MRYLSFSGVSIGRAVHQSNGGARDRQGGTHVRRAIRTSIRRGWVILLILVAAIGCVNRRVPPPDRAATLRVRVTVQGDEGANLRTFLVRSLRIAPRPPLPSAWLPRATGGGGMTAMGSDARRRPVLFVIEEGEFIPLSLTVFPVSSPPEHERRGWAIPAVQMRPRPPCESWSGFFVRGIGDRPSRPVVLSRWQNDGGSASLLIDPARHTLPLQPVLRFSTRDVKSLRNQSATIIFGITATSGATPFVLLGLVRRPDGSYSEAVFMPTGEELGWGGFVHHPGETTEVSFYALDDSAAVRSPCRK